MQKDNSSENQLNPINRALDHILGNLYSFDNDEIEKLFAGQEDKINYYKNLSKSNATARKVFGEIRTGLANANAFVISKDKLQELLQTLNSQEVLDFPPFAVDLQLVDEPEFYDPELVIHIYELALNSRKNYARNCSIFTQYDGSELIVTINDNGIGMNLSEIESNIKEGVSGTESTGLGLPLAIAYVLENQGKVKIYSKADDKINTKRRGIVLESGKDNKVDNEIHDSTRGTTIVFNLPRTAN